MISEIQLAGGSNDEFIELYNPTEHSISLANWQITKKTSSGTETDLIATMSGTIGSHGYFLIARPEYDGAVIPDVTYSGNLIANDNTILLYNNVSSLVDKVGLGSAVDKETTAVANPLANHSVERKANSSSTVTTMTSGVDAAAGNGEDTDNNSNDFISRVVSDPQNSISAPEPMLLTSTPIPSATPTPTDTPSFTPTVTLIPTLTPTVSFTMTPTITPSLPTAPTFTITPVPTIPSSPTPTALTLTLPVSPTANPTPTPTPPLPTVTPIHREHHLRFHLIFSWRVRVINIYGHTFRISYLHCEREKNHTR